MWRGGGGGSGRVKVSGGVVPRLTMMVDGDVDKWWVSDEDFIASFLFFLALRFLVMMVLVSH